MKSVLFILLAIGAILFCYFFIKDYVKMKAQGRLKQGYPVRLAIVGFILCFLDALGVGCFAPMTAAFRNFNLVKDRLIPGTLNTAVCIPTILQSFLFIDKVEVDPVTLTSMIGAAILGSLLGVKIVCLLKERTIQLGLGTALGVFCLIMIAGKLGLMPVGGHATGLSGIKLLIAIVGNFILGALMTFGIGLYAPCMTLVYALGLDPLVAFPIMMGSCAYLMPWVSIKFIKQGAYNRVATMSILVAGSIGVFMAVQVVDKMSIDLLSWLILIVVLYTAVKLLIDAKKSPNICPDKC